MTRGCPGSPAREVVDQAAASGCPTSARVLTTRDGFGPADWLATLFAPLAVQGSIVFVRNGPDESVIERRMSQERVTNRV